MSTPTNQQNGDEELQLQPLSRRILTAFQHLSHLTTTTTTTTTSPPCDDPQSSNTSTLPRESIISCIELTLSRLLTAHELGSIPQFFALLGASPFIDIQEFTTSYREWRAHHATPCLSSCLADSPQLPVAVEEVQGRKQCQGQGRFKSRSRLLEARKKGMHATASVHNDSDQVTSHQIGWGAQAAVQPSAFLCKGQRNAPLRGSDVTAGGLGTSMATYYGAALGKTF